MGDEEHPLQKALDLSLVVFPDTCQVCGTALPDDNNYYIQLALSNPTVGIPTPEPSVENMAVAIKVLRDEYIKMLKEQLEFMVVTEDSGCAARNLGMTKWVKCDQCSVLIPDEQDGEPYTCDECALKNGGDR